jgi:hypothetical protein
MTIFSDTRAGATTVRRTLFRSPSHNPGGGVFPGLPHTPLRPKEEGR